MMQSKQQSGGLLLKKATQNFRASEFKVKQGGNLGGKAPSDRIDAKSVSDQFFSQHNRTLAMQSFQILSQCYHPNFLSGKEAAPGDYLLILEQQYRPSYQSSLKDGKRAEKPTTSVQLSEYRNYKIQNDFGAIHEDEGIEEEDKEEEDMLIQANNLERPVGRISCQYRSLAKHFRNQIGIGAAVGDEKVSMRSGDKNSQASAKRDSAQLSPVSQQPASSAPNRKGFKSTVKQSTNPNFQIGKSKVLNHLIYGKNDEVDPRTLRDSTFKVTLWKVESGEPSIILAEQKIEVTKEVFILKNKLHFSQDGKYIYLVLVDQDLRLWRSVILDSQGLNHSFELDFDFSALEINGQEITCDPQMMRLKDEFLNLIGKGQGLDETQMNNKAGGYVICFQDSENIILCSHKSRQLSFPRNLTSSEGNLLTIEHLITSVDDSEEKMVFLVKMRMNKEDVRPKLITYLTSISKTIQKIFATGGVRFQDEVIYTSNILIQEEGVSGDYHIKKSFFHKDFGLFVNLAKAKQINSDESGGEKKSILFYLPRTSLFTGKDINQLGFAMQDLHIQPNSNLIKDPCFISFFEQQYHVFLAKDLIKSKDEPVFENKNTYTLKEKVSMRTLNTLDFKIYLQQGYCTIVNMSQETFERPYIIFFNKQFIGQEDEGTVVVLDKFETLNLNPYVVVVEDKSIINIYSLVDPDRHYLFKIEEQFLQFVDITKGSIQMSNEKYFRHQVCMFLTLNDKGQVKINCIIMPSYSDIQDGNKIFKLNVLPYSIEWSSKYKNQQIYKAFFVQYPSKNDSNLSLILQIHQKVIVYNLFTMQPKSFPTSSSVPMLQQHLDDAVPDDPQREKLAPKSFIFYIHTILGSQQGISQLEISPIEQARITNIYEFNGPMMVRMQQILGNTLITLDDNIQIKMFKLQSKTMKLKLLEDYRLIEEARKVINNPVTAASATIEMTREAVYINHVFYQILKKSATKDALTEFENQREKRAERHLSNLTWCLGPYLSLDKQNLIYFFRSNRSISAMAKQDGKDLISGTGDQNALMTNRGLKLLRGLIRMRERCIMKPDESTYKMVQVPLLMSNQMSLLHRDDFYRENVEISTFTPDNDIILKLQDKFLAFDKHGNQLTIKVDEDVQGQGILQNFKLLQCQIVEQELGLRFENNDLLLDGTVNVSNDRCSFLGFVFEQAATNKICVIQVRKSEELGYTLSFWKWKVPQNIIRQDSLEDPFFQVRLRMTHLESDGNLYQLLVFQVQERDRMVDDISFVKYPERQDEDREKSFAGLNTKLARLFQQKSKRVLKTPTDSNNSVRSSVSVSAQNSITELLLKPGNQEEEQFLDFDFQLLPPLYDSDKETVISQYIVLKRDLDLHFFDIKDIGAIRDPNRHLERVSLDLDNGQITQILATSQPNIVQFVFTQAKPLQHYVFNWDLKRNMEVQMHAYTPSQIIPYVNVIRGVTARENYFVPLTEKHIYDLRFQYPLNFFNGSEANKGHDKIDFQEKVFKKDFSKYYKFLAGKCDDNKQEYKVAGKSCALLGFSKPRVTTLQYPFSYISLQYVQYIVDAYKENKQRSDEKQKIKPILDFLKVNLQQETNILHVFALDEGFLRAIAREIRYQMNDLGDKDALSFVYYVLLPRNISTKKGRRPFSIAINQYSPKCLENMLDMLTLDNKQDYMRYVERYLLKLLQMKSPVFYKFFDVCCQKFQFRMQGTLKDQTVYLKKQSQYINQSNFMKTFQTQVADNSGSFWKIVCCCFTKRKAAVKVEEEEDQEDQNNPQPQRPKSVQPDSLQDKLQKGIMNQVDNMMIQMQVSETDGAAENSEGQAGPNNVTSSGFSYDNDDALSEEGDYDEAIQEGGSKKKKASINFYSYEFDHIIKGKKGEQLIDYISNQPLNSPLFESPTVQAYLDSQWQHFKWQYYMIVILYILSFAIMFPYFELFEYASSDTTLSFSQMMTKHWLFFFIFLPGQFAVSLYLTFYETKKMIATKDKWQLPIVLYNFWQVIMPFFDLVKQVLPEQNNQEFAAIYRALTYGLNANFLIMGLLVLFYKIKYLNFASFYITRMFLIISEIIPLTLIIFAAEMAFAYAYKIIYEISPDHNNGIGTVFKAFNFFFEQTFEQLWGLWRKKPSDHIEEITDEFTLVLLVVLTIMVVSTNLFMVYFLIAAIIESYNKVSQNLKNQEYLSRSKILFENSLLFRRDEAFASTRYIIKAQAESIAGQDSQGDWDGLSSAITASVRSTIEQESLKTDTNFKFMKNKLTKIASGQESIQTLQDSQVEFREKMQTIVALLMDLQGKSGGGGGPSASMMSQFAKKK